MSDSDEETDDDSDLPLRNITKKQTMKTTSKTNKVTTSNKMFQTEKETVHTEMLQK